MKKQPEVTERTKAMLMDTFWQLYCQKGIHKITVKDVTDKAGYNRSTFYQYFTDVYDVLNQIEDSLIEYVAENSQESLMSDGGDDTIQHLAQLYDSKGAYLSVLLGNGGDPMFVNKLKSVIRPLVMSRVGRNKTDFRTELLFEFAISGVLAAVTFWHNQGKIIPAEQIVVLVRTMLIHAAASVIPQQS